MSLTIAGDSHTGWTYTARHNDRTVGYRSLEGADSALVSAATTANRAAHATTGAVAGLEPRVTRR